MTLLISGFAAIIVLVIWYKGLPEDNMKISILCFLYTGATIMWFVDAIFEYVELQEEYFIFPLESVINDSILGLSVVLLGLIIWLVILFVSDPQQKIKAFLKRKSNK